jgi:anaerobic selenocysteine-containing dehydrogenase
MSKQIYNPSRRDFLKGVAIGAGGYAFGSMLIHPKEAMAQSIEGYLEKVSMETRWNFVTGSAIGLRVDYHKKLLDTEGREKYLEYIQKSSTAAGAGSKGLADRLGFTGNNAKSVAVIIPAVLTIFFGPKQKFEIGQATENKARVTCIECAFWNGIQAKKITDDICSAESQYYWAAFGKAMNPKMTVNLVKARPLGDSVCEWVLELKA